MSTSIKLMYATSSSAHGIIIILSTNGITMICVTHTHTHIHIYKLYCLRNAIGPYVIHSMCFSFHPSAILSLTTVDSTISMKLGTDEHNIFR